MMLARASLWKWSKMSAYTAIGLEVGVPVGAMTVVGQWSPCFHLHHKIFLLPAPSPLSWERVSSWVAAWGVLLLAKASPTCRQRMAGRAYNGGIPATYKHRTPRRKENNWSKWTMFAREQIGESRINEYIYITGLKGMTINPQIWKSLLEMQWATTWKRS